MVANQEIIDQFIQNLKINPNKVHYLTGEMKKSLKNRYWKQISIHKYTRKTLEDISVGEKVQLINTMGK